MTTHCDLCYVTVRIMGDILKEESNWQCFERVKQRRQEGTGVPRRGIGMCTGMEDREDLLWYACSTRRCLVRLEGRGG